ncbi:MAG: penicillin acylase family protein, partial [Planctomycetota bacterium]
MNAIEPRRRSAIGVLGEPASIARPDPLAAPARDRGRGAGRRLAAGVLALACTIAATAGPETARANEPIALASLAAPVEVRFDPLGVPEIDARSRLDAIAAEGFVHGRDRLFQMDLMRRNAAGELAALLGPFVVERDLAARVHARRDLARRILDRLPEEDRRLLRRYSDGVNAAIDSIDMPPEYALFGWPPAPWRPEDSVLTALSMHEMLASNRGVPRRGDVRVPAVPGLAVRCPARRAGRTGSRRADPRPRRVRADRPARARSRAPTAGTPARRRRVGTRGDDGVGRDVHRTGAGPRQQRLRGGGRP